MNTTKLNLGEDTQNMLAQTGCTGYTLHGYAPVSSVFYFTIDQLKTIVDQNTRPYLDDLDSVSIQPNPRNGKISAYIWLPKNSHNLTNNELNASNSAIKKSLTIYSQQLKEYMDKFCYPDTKRLLPEESNKRVSGIEICLNNILNVELDVTGAGYGRRVGRDYAKKCTLKMHSVWHSGERKYEKFRYLFVEKVLADSEKFNNTKDYRPKKSYNAR